jgi:hypothetical protein
MNDNGDNDSGTGITLEIKGKQSIRMVCHNGQTDCG